MKTSRYALCHLLAVTTLILAFGSASPAADPWITFEGSDGPAKGKHVVLISGDEEYRSEETLPQLAKILAKHHGFKCTVLFAIDPKDGTINPNRRDNIPGLEALKTADLMVIFTRFRDLPDAQMKYIADYVESGRPIIGLRTATHAFDIKGDKTYAKYTWNSKTWDGGFGRQVLGETWISHHGQHGRQSTRRDPRTGDAVAPDSARHTRGRHLGSNRCLRRASTPAGRYPAARPGTGAGRNATRRQPCAG